MPLVSLCLGCRSERCARLIPYGTKRCPEHAAMWAQADNRRRHAKARELGRRGPRAWQHFRLLILERDGHTCQTCGVSDDLTVHYKPGGPHSTDPADYLTLCRRCHGRVDQPRSVSTGGRAQGERETRWPCA